MTSSSGGRRDDDGRADQGSAAAAGKAGDRPDGDRDRVELEQLAIAVEQLLDLHGALREQVETLAEQVPSTGPKVFRWAQLDAGEAEAAWTALAGWVDWLLDRHIVKEVPRGCWWRHGSMVEELTALWWAWQAAYDPKADPRAPLMWLEQLDRARDRIRLRLTQQGACMTGEHRAAPIALDNKAALADFDVFVRTDVGRRHTDAAVPAGPAAHDDGGD